MASSISFCYYHEDGTRETIFLDQPSLSGPDVDPKMRHYRFNPIPADASTGDRFYFLGWPTSLKELTELGIRHRKKGSRSREDPFYDGFHYLMAASRFGHLATVLVEPQTVEEKNAPENKNGLAFIMLWVNEVKQFRHMPTQGQVDKLVKILKREPEWYRDFYEPEDFYRHNIC